jgi:arylsulfatase A-like enzyme
MRRLLLLVVALGFAATAVADRPNIVVILADDLGWGDVKCFNSDSKIPTPQLDRLAREGLRFTDAHTASSVCTPTRYGLLTGRYPWRTRLQSGVLNGFSPPLIARDRMTVASLLKSQGYATACIGKWHLGVTWTTNNAALDWKKPLLDGPTNHGFDYFYGVSASLDMPPYVFIENDRVTSVPTTEKKWIRSGPAAEDFEAEDALPILTRKASEWIGQRTKDSKPFFLYLAFTAPHTPILPTKEWQRKSGLNAYGDFVMQTDAAVGQVLDALEKAGAATNTLVIFTSDNGCSPAAGAGELQAKGHNPAGPWRGLKSDIWEGGHRVPFIARWPGHINAGASNDETICLNDLLATTAALVGAKFPENAGEDGVNILPALLGEKLRQPLREATVHHSIEGKFAIRQGPWKLALCPGSGGWMSPKDVAATKQGLPAVQLYNLTSDPVETKNVQAEHPEIVTRLTKLLEKYVADGRSTPGKALKNDATVDIWKK